jgi:predicted ATP-grasp superfamily ATP-dependent carboligase
MAVTEFKEDPEDGRLVLFECNARFNLAVALLRASGFDLALLAYRRALGEPPPRMGPPRWGRHLWHPGPDFRSFLDYRRCGEMTTGEWARSLLHRQTFSLLAHDDPWPSVVEQAATARRALALGRRRVNGTAG